MHDRRPATPHRTVPAWGRALAVLAAILAAGYLGAMAWLVTQETRIVFRAGPLGTARPAFPYQQVDVPRPDGARQFAWAMAHDGDSARPWLLFLHGNASTIASRVNIARYRELRGFGLNVLAPEYRGYAGLPGTPTEAGLGADARAAYDYLRDNLRVPPERIVVYGWSLGSAVAVDLAAGVPSAAVILEGAPASLVAIGQREYPWFPIRLLMRNPFESIRKVSRISAPMLFLHSPEDTVIPIEEGRRLFEAAAAPKTFVEVRGGHIYANEVDPAAFFGAIRAFLVQHHLIDAPAEAASR
jgi:fermentation-respiration switch protein FrsA (DUF1100 family)